MLLDGLPLTDRIRFQFDKAPTTRRVRKRDQCLGGSPEASFPLHADRERLQRTEQRQIARRAAGHEAQGTTSRATGEPLGRPRGVPELGQDALNDAAIVAKLFVERSK